jgi:hypothetical protein
MTFFYMLVLVFSAWLITYGLVWAQARVVRTLGISRRIPPNNIALGVALVMLIVADAPVWLFLLIVAFMVAMHTPTIRARLPITPRQITAMALLLLMVSPLLGASIGFALDAVIIAACLLGASHAS